MMALPEMSLEERMDRLEQRLDIAIECMRELGKALAIADKIDLLIHTMQHRSTP